MDMDGAKDMQDPMGMGNGTMTIEELRKEILEVRKRIVDVITEMDSIRLQRIPRIKTDYAVRVGCWETQLLEAEFACRRAKRKLALAQARVNAGEDVDDTEIEMKLDDEFLEWSIRMTEALRNQREALLTATTRTVMLPGEAREVKKLYRTLCKRLHPDLHPGDEVCADFFLAAQLAYKNGVLSTLRALEVVTRGMDKGDSDIYEMDEEELHVALELSRVELEMMEEQRDELLKDPIFEVERNLASVTWLERTISGLKAAIKEFNDSREEYERKLKVLLEGERR